MPASARVAPAKPTIRGPNSPSASSVAPATSVSRSSVSASIGSSSASAKAVPPSWRAHQAIAAVRLVALTSMRRDDARVLRWEAARARRLPKAVARPCGWEPGVSESISDPRYRPCLRSAFSTRFRVSAKSSVGLPGRMSETIAVY